MMEVSGDGTTSNMIRCKAQDMALDLTEWHHYVVGVDLSKGGWDKASCIGPYIDGVNLFDEETAITSATSGIAGSGTSLYTGTAAFGTHYETSSAPWEGELDELQLWSR